MRSKRGPLGLLVAHRRVVRSRIRSVPRPGRIRHREMGSADLQRKHRHAAGLGETIGGLFPLPKSAGQCTATNRRRPEANGSHRPPATRTSAITDFTLNTHLPATKASPTASSKTSSSTRRKAERQPRGDARKCTVEQMEANPALTCPPNAIVGTNYLTVAVEAASACVPPLPDRQMRAGARRSSRSTTWSPSKACPRWSPSRPRPGNRPSSSAILDPGRPARQLHDQRHPRAAGTAARRSSARGSSSTATRPAETAPT